MNEVNKEKPILSLKCFRCGHDVEWSGTETNKEVFGDTYRDTDFSQVNFYHCPYCGADYEVYDVSKSERKDYPAWK